MPDVLMVLSDSPDKQTGFARVTQNLLRRWAPHFARIDVWAVGYNGWRGAPGQVEDNEFQRPPYVLYPAAAPGESWFSRGCLSDFLAHLKDPRAGYTHLWIHQDHFPFAVEGFATSLRQICEARKIVSSFYVPVDGRVRKEWLDLVGAVDRPVAYTEYGARQIGRALGWSQESGESEAARRGLTRPTTEATIPHSALRTPHSEMPHLPLGVDTAVYHPLPDREALRRELFEGWIEPGHVLMVNVNMHQRRKDAPRSLELLAELHRRGATHYRLLMHMNPLSAEKPGGEVHLERVAEQLGLSPHLWRHTESLFNGTRPALREEGLNRIYNGADLLLSTSLGEGWGLSITEALAAGCVVAVPDHTACREIVQTVREMGMDRRALLLPCEEHGLVLPLDNSVLRHRVDVAGAASLIMASERAGWFGRQEAGGRSQLPASVARSVLECGDGAKGRSPLLDEPRPAAIETSESGVSPVPLQPPHSTTLARVQGPAASVIETSDTDTRAGLNDPVRAWLDWDRIAAAWREIFRQGKVERLPVVDRWAGIPGVVQQAEAAGWEGGLFDFPNRRDGEIYFNCGFVRRGTENFLVPRCTVGGRNQIRFYRLKWSGMEVGDPVCSVAARDEFTHFEDPRCLLDPETGGFLLSYCQYRNTGERFLTQQTLLPLGAKFEPGPARHIYYGHNGPAPGQATGHEKNWTWFRNAECGMRNAEEAGLYLIYSIDPHVVLRIGSDNQILERWKTQLPTPHSALRTPHWGYGTLRGGTPPVRRGEEYVSFFHSSLAPAGGHHHKRRYFMGAYAFEAQPPWRITRMTPEPLLVGSRKDPLLPWSPMVVFPCGLADTGSKWFVTLGVNDAACAWVKIPHDELEKRMVAV